MLTFILSTCETRGLGAAEDKGDVVFHKISKSFEISCANTRIQTELRPSQACL